MSSKRVNLNGEHVENLSDGGSGDCESPTGAERVNIFIIPEILENVLRHLPNRDLLLAQGVQKSFRNLIKTSPRLQRKLFFKTDLFPEQGPIPDLQWNPLLKPFVSQEPFDESICAQKSLQLDRAAIARAQGLNACCGEMFLTEPAATEIKVKIKVPTLPTEVGWIYMRASEGLKINRLVAFCTAEHILRESKERVYPNEFVVYHGYTQSENGYNGDRWFGTKFALRAVVGTIFDFEYFHAQRVTEKDRSKEEGRFYIEFRKLIGASFAPDS